LKGGGGVYHSPSTQRSKGGGYQKIQHFMMHSKGNQPAKELKGKGGKVSSRGAMLKGPATLLERGKKRRGGHLTHYSLLRWPLDK